MKINKLIMLFSALAIFSGIFYSCEDESATSNPLGSTDYVGIEAVKSLEIVLGETVVVENKVFATQKSNSDRVIELAVLPAPATTMSSEIYTVPASVTIPAGSLEGKFDVSITSEGLGGGQQLVIGIVPQEGLNIATSMTAPDAEGVFSVFYQNLVIKAREYCPLNGFRVEINTDAYGSETTWELYDSSFNLIGNGGPYADQSAIGVYPQEPVGFCLEDGNYTFVIYDAPYSDGMNSGYGEGFYRLVKTVNGVDVEIANNGVFGAMEEVTFSLP